MNYSAIGPKNFSRYSRAGLRLAVLVAAIGCGSRSATDGAARPSSWFQRYRPIEDKEARRFLWNGLEAATRMFGEPATPVRTIHLRLSEPVDPEATIRRGFCLTELCDPVRGEFAIYLSATPREDRFHGQLGHEIAHLLNAKLCDAYVEGLNTVFAERWVRACGKKWEGWHDHFLAGKEPFYGATYFLMKDVCEEAGDEAMGRFLRFATPMESKPQWQRIDINGWLATLEPARRGRVVAVIERHREEVQASRGSQFAELALERPTP